MTTAAASNAWARPEPDAISVVPAIAVSAFASIAAGAIHAAAIGVHSEHRQAVIAFTALAIAQIGWGILALFGAGRVFTATGVAINAAAIGGWILAKTDGISFIDGLDVAEDPQFADTMAMGLAAVAVLGAFAALTLLRASRPSFGRVALVITAAVATVAATPAMVNAGSHSHAGGGHGHGGDDGAVAADDGHDHGEETEGHDAHDADARAGTDDDHGAGHESAVVAPKPYDPTQPIDLGGVDGVTLEQQARAENLIAITLLELPKYADPATAEADGFRSIGDAATGYEHYINQSYFDDGRILDPDYPESLVYTPDSAGGKKLVAAMYMLEPDATLDDVPDVGGKLTQWHIHNNLCFTAEARVAGLTEPDGSCPTGLVKGNEAPMIHVWITSHPCGPFAALEGVGGGQINEGEERLCDQAHGSH